MELATLQALSYSAVIFFVTAYLIMDGFDLGIGSLQLFGQNTHERRIMLNSIGPFWDGNEVWLIVFGASLFGLFPMAYGSIFSGFYLLILLFALGLIMRAVAIEFRGKSENEKWRFGWDVLFSSASSVIGFGLGIVVGNIIRGVPLDNSTLLYSGSRLLGLLHPYCLLVGGTLWSIFAMHGSIFLLIKTEDHLQTRARKWFSNLYVLTLILYSGMLITTFKTIPQFAQLAQHWSSIQFCLIVIKFVAIVSIPIFVSKECYWKAFISSSVMIASAVALFASTYYPYIVYNVASPEHSITALNSSGSAMGLRNFLILAVIVIPLVIAYTVYVHKVFAGKVKLSEHSY
jgi:cytochrome d ubiquinol oxidase subunit II